MRYVIMKWVIILRIDGINMQQCLQHLHEHVRRFQSDVHWILSCDFDGWWLCWNSRNCCGLDCVRDSIRTHFYGWHRMPLRFRRKLRFRRIQLRKDLLRNDRLRKLRFHRRKLQVPRKNPHKDKIRFRHMPGRCRNRRNLIQRRTIRCHSNCRRKFRLLIRHIHQCASLPSSSPGRPWWPIPPVVVVALPPKLRQQKHKRGRRKPIHNVKS